MTDAPIGIYVRDGTSDYSIFNEVFSSNTYSADLIDYASVGAVYDLGAHIGAFSRFVKERNPNARIVAVEPDLHNAICFLFNMQQFGGVMLITARVAYEWADVQIVRNAVNSGGIAFVCTDDPALAALPDGLSSASGNDYPVVTLEQLGTGEVDVLKIDIEGAEFDVLLNAPMPTLSRFRWIVGEYHGVSGSFAAIVQRLTPHFTLQRQEDTGGEMGYFCFERRTDDQG